ncbi:endonuclease/exonuclease/phosphatase family protein [Streptomyces sp. bgisy159]|uniref:endonuclease/exonuclease/phosphatase family protein n=1 Tax=Streptomyces sp. bgisy159 TaxID=3413795 RepID=UPI003F4A29CA
MRIISWNLLNGGQDNGDRYRLGRAVDIIRSCEADLVFLQEARNFDAQDNRLLNDVGRRLRLAGFLSTADSGYHVAAFVRHELGATCARFGRPDFFHALISIRIPLPNGGVLHALGAHWCPDSPEIRLAEAEHLIRLLRGDEPALVVGDLNSPEPHADHTSTFAKAQLRIRTRYLASDGSGKVDARALECLESAGLVDVGRLRGSTGHTLPTPLPLPGPSFPRLRLDYCYATEPLAAIVTDYRVLKNAETDQISDHYPIVVDIDVSRLDIEHAESP